MGYSHESKESIMNVAFMEQKAVMNDDLSFLGVELHREHSFTDKSEGEGEG